MRDTPFTLFYSGYFWVWVFFILSGFVLPLNFFRQGKISSVTGGTFRRYFRLMIPLLIVHSIYYIPYTMGYTTSHMERVGGTKVRKTFFLLIFDATINTWYGDTSWQ